ARASDQPAEQWRIVPFGGVDASLSLCTPKSQSIGERLVAVRVSELPVARFTEIDTVTDDPLNRSSRPAPISVRRAQALRLKPPRHLDPRLTGRGSLKQLRDPWAGGGVGLKPSVVSSAI